MSLSTVTKAPRWSPVTTNKINGPLGRNVVLHRLSIIILPLYALNNKNTAVASSAKRVISTWQSNVFFFVRNIIYDKQRYLYAVGIFL